VVEDWAFDYTLAFNDSGLDEFGRGWERMALVVSGPLTSRTRRKATRVKLRIEPSAVFDPHNWKEQWKAVGYVTGVQRGTIVATVILPTSSFQVFMAAASKLRALAFTVTKVERGKGSIRFFGTADDDEPA
jgi:hypothetical protein